MRFHCFAGILALASAVFMLTTAANAQHTPVAGSTIGAVGSTYGAVADDVLRKLTDEQIADRSNDSARKAGGWQGSGFTMGRLRNTDHDGYTTNGFGGTSLEFDANEATAVGFVTLSTSGPQPNSQMTFGAYAGYSNLNIDLQPNEQIFGDLRDPGTAANKAAIYGISVGYGVDSLYMTATAAGFSGDSEIDDRANNFRPEFNTNGYIVAGLVGNMFQLGNVGGAASFATLEGALKHAAFEGDEYLSQTGLSLFEQDYDQTTLSVAIGIFQIYSVGESIVRPYVRGTLSKDVRYSNESTIKGLDGSNPDVTKFDDEDVRGTAEVGMIVKSGDWNLSGAGYAEFSDSHHVIGARLGATYNIPLQ